MKISVAQIKAVKGDIEQNLKNHIHFIEKALSMKADMIVFPELSLTGYELELAEKLKTTHADKRLDPLQELSNQNNIIIGVGLPTGEGSHTYISMIIFQPHQERITYSKQYLYPPEKEFFTAGNQPLAIHIDKETIVAPAICYELANKEHQETARKNGATIYVVSVLNSVNGIDADIKKLSRIARKYRMTTFMSNYVGVSGEYECAGKSSIWNNEGELLAQLDDQTEGLVMYDTQSRKITAILF